MVGNRQEREGYGPFTPEQKMEILDISIEEMEIEVEVEVEMDSTTGSQSESDDMIDAIRQASGPSSRSSSTGTTDSACETSSSDSGIGIHSCTTPKDTDWFACPECFKAFKHCNSLYDHMELKHGIMGPFEIEEEEEEEEELNDEEEENEAVVNLGNTCSKVDLTSHEVGRRLEVLDSDIDGQGLFTGTAISKDEFVIEYTGEIITNILAARRRYSYEANSVKPFIMKIDKFLWDATAYGNCSKYINNSCDPNCRAELIEIHGKHRVLIFSNRAIAVGEEITFDYKLESDVLVLCNCGTPSCRQFLNYNLVNVLGNDELKALAGSYQ